MMLGDGTPLLANKGLDFKITECSVAKPYDVKWKVLNRGDEHVVECYIVKDGIVVARDIIDVPISTNGA
jgi:hypothetical protein